MSESDDVKRTQLVRALVGDINVQEAKKRKTARKSVAGVEMLYIRAANQAGISEALKALQEFKGADVSDDSEP